MFRIVGVGALVGLLGCGGDRGTYQGRATWSLALDGKVRNTEQVDIHQLIDGTASDLVVVSQNCDLPASSPDGRTLQVLSTPCITWQNGAEYDLTVTGVGQVSKGTHLSLMLTGPITVHRQNGDAQGTFTYLFGGERL